MSEHVKFFVSTLLNSDTAKRLASKQVHTHRSCGSRKPSTQSILLVGCVHCGLAVGRNGEQKLLIFSLSVVYAGPFLVTRLLPQPICRYLPIPILSHRRPGITRCRTLVLRSRLLSENVSSTTFIIYPITRSRTRNVTCAHSQMVSEIGNSQITT